MSPLAKRVAKIEQASNTLPHKHLVWVEYDDDPAAIDDKIADLKACITVGWLQPTHMK
jgi:hypothetical protein